MMLFNHFISYHDLAAQYAADSSALDDQENEPIGGRLHSRWTGLVAVFQQMAR